MRLFVYVLLGFSYLLSNILRTSAAVVFPALVSRLGMGAALAGFLSSLFFYAYGLAQPWTGPMHNRYGPLRVVGWGMAGTALAMGLLATVDSVFQLVLSRLISGLGTAPLFSGLMIYTTVAFAGKRLPFFMGLNMCWAYIGTILSGTPLGMALDGLGHARVFALLAGTTLALGGALLAFARRDPVPREYAHLPRIPFLSRRFGAEMKRGLGLIKNSRSVLALVTVWAVANAAMLSMQGLWGVLWITSALDVPESAARTGTMFLSIGMAVAAPWGGRLAAAVRRVPYRLGLLYLFLMLSWIALCLCMALKIPYVAVPAFFVGNGTALCIVYSNGELPRLIDGKDYGLVLGLANMLVFLVSTVFQGLSGLVIGEASTPAAGYLAAHVLMVAALGWSCLFWRAAVSKIQ